MLSKLMWQFISKILFWWVFIWLLPGCLCNTFLVLFCGIVSACICWFYKLRAFILSTDDKVFWAWVNSINVGIIGKVLVPNKRMKTDLIKGAQSYFCNIFSNFGRFWYHKKAHIFRITCVEFLWLKCVPFGRYWWKCAWLW